MYLYERLGILFYVLVICATGYLGIASLSSLWTNASTLKKLSSANKDLTVSYGERKLLILDDLEPTSGE